MFFQEAFGVVVTMLVDPPKKIVRFLRWAAECQIVVLPGVESLNLTHIESTYIYTCTITSYLLDSLLATLSHSKENPT